MTTPLRIGQGYDIHRLVPNRDLWLGGVNIPSPIGLLGHSDADALLHCIIDAILGALCLEDIGTWFPDTDPAWKNADSRELLRTVLKDPRVSPWHVVNLDCTIIAEQPKLGPYKLPIRQSLSSLLNCPLDAVAVKAKTHEKLDSLGQGEAISALCVILLEKTPEP